MTDYLKLGGPWPFASSRGLTGRPCAPVWHALITAPQQEAKAAHQLEAAGAGVQYPTFERVRHHHGKKRTYTVPMMPRIIYAEFRYEPQWDVMRSRRVISGVFCRSGKPVVLSADDVALVMGLPTEAERQEVEINEANRPRAGQKAEIIEGPFAGFFVDVTRVEYGRVWYEMAMGIKGQAPDLALRKVVG